MKLGPMELLIILVPAIICSCASGSIAKRRGCNPVPYYLLGFFFSVFGILITYLMTKDSKPTSASDLLAYKELLDKGAITQEEFDRKKKEALQDK